MKPIAIFQLGSSSPISLHASSNATKTQVGGTAAAAFTVNSGGTITCTSQSAYTWLQFGASSSYEVRATQQANNGLGALSGSSLSSWINCSGSPSWTLSRTGIGEATVTLLIEIRPVSGAVIASTQVNYDCTVN